MTAWHGRRREGAALGAAMLSLLLLAVAPLPAVGATATPTEQPANPAADPVADATTLEEQGDARAGEEAWAEALDAYQQALDIRMRLAKAKPRDAGLSASLATAHEKVGHVLGRLERHDAAAESLAAALKLRSALLKGAPKDEAVRRGHAATGLALAEALLSAGRAEAGLKPAGDAVKTLRDFAKASPDDPAARFDLAAALVTEASLRFALGRQDETAERAGEARALFEPAAPANPAARRGLARALVLVGNASLESDAFEAAKSAFQESFSTAEAGPPGDGSDMDRAAALERIGWTAQRQGAIAEAVRAYEWSRAIYAAVVGRRPADVDAGYMASDLANRIGEARTEEGDTTRALVLHGEALAGFRALVAMRPDIWRYRRGVVDALRGQAAAGDAPRERLQQALDLVAASKKAGILADADAWLAEDLREALAEARP